MQTQLIEEFKIPEIPRQELHPKNQLQKDRLLNSEFWICMERAKFYTDTYKETEGEYPTIRAAKALKHTFENMTINIYPEELMVGNRSSQFLAPPISPERGDMTAIFKWLFPMLKKKHGYHISKEHKKWLEKEILPYWKDKSVRDLKVKAFEEAGLLSKFKLGDGGLKRIKEAFGLKHIIKLLEEENSNWKDRIKFILTLPKLIKSLKAATADNIKGRGRCIDVQAHIVIGHKNILKLGFKGMKEQAEKRLKTAEKESEKGFLKGVIITCNAMKDFSNRFSLLAKKMADETVDSERKSELLRISEATRKVPWNPPDSFYEAIQSIWFTQNAMIVSYGAGSLLALGRMDQLLYPYYIKDIMNKTLTNDEVLRLIEEFIIKINTNLIIWPNKSAVRLNHLGSDIENITLGGLGPDGEDATNPITFLFIEAVKNTKLATNASFRFSKDSPEEYVRRVLEIHKDTNSPALFNDEFIIKAMERDGYTPEAARDYCLVGCVEQSGNGDTYGATGGSKLNFPTILDLVFNRGKTTFYGNQETRDTGDPTKFKTFDEFMNAFYIQLQEIVDVVADATIIRDKIWAENYHVPLISCTIDGCIENAKDSTDGGSDYYYSNIGGGGLATLVDSLAAIRKFVYEEKKVSMEELIDALHTNFKNKERLRQLLSNGPKYGNDNDYVDTLAVEIIDRWSEMVNNKKTMKKGHFKPSCVSYGLNLFEGILEPATPNGRKAGEPFSNSISPCNGVEVEGPTATFNSVAKINHFKLGYGSSLNMRFPSFILKPDNIDIFKALVESYFEKGGTHVQVNTMGSECLREAQVHPENHQDLIVRVSGFAAYFTKLGKEIQDDIIDRCEFTI